MLLDQLSFMSKRFICKKKKCHTIFFSSRFFFEETKLAQLNCHRSESNLKSQGGAHFQVPSQYHQANTDGFCRQES